ncbi:UV radiation resistance protein and autophagy-related subunit 14-domain-containing protein [Echria macrotheca]|uniref:Autophagy-related protein 14 n=1 Tax=Echria macrotheca TaxID=438768 RepID=A0AAJ0F805_9PEZI|nr:UV radiation resistance protein and autophagy-related subunit 14-domain-containing protein [Echria macrotheca]
MKCSICRKPHHSRKRPFLCAVDARNRLYEGRIEIVKGLIESEAAEREIEKTRDEGHGRIVSLKAEEAAATDRTDQIIAQAERLRTELETARKDIDARKDVIARRRSDLAAVLAGWDARKARQLEEMERSMQRTVFKWTRSSETMAATRAFLCEEAARLYGLRQVKKGSVKRYEIGGVEILELHAMYNADPEQVSTSLAHVAHILVLTSHYLALRLPAEITLPHRDHPHPTVFSIASSYRRPKVAARHGKHVTGGAPDNPTDADDPQVLKVRPLHIEKPLSVLAREDSQAFAQFIEGVSFLAYDIAWACSTQGVSFGDKDSYDDIANMGQNLWRLLIGDQVHRRSVEPTFPAMTPTEETNAEMMATKPQSMMGRWSHGTTYAYLGGAEGNELVRIFKIMSPARLADNLKRRLSSEAPMLEWETIEGDEAEDVLEEGILVHGGLGGTTVRCAPAGKADADCASVMGMSGVAESDRGNNLTKGSSGSGWTKLKNR